MDIERATNSENPSTVGSVDDMTTKVDILFTVESYAGPTVKPVITTGYSARRGSYRYGPTMIRITVGYLKIVGEGPMVNIISIVVLSHWLQPLPKGRERKELHGGTGVTNQTDSTTSPLLRAMDALEIVW